MGIEQRSHATPLSEVFENLWQDQVEGALEEDRHLVS